MRARMLLCVLSVAALTNGCVIPNVAPLLKDIADSISDARKKNSPLPEAWQGLSFRNTDLYGLFAKYEPYDNRKPFDQQYPRVALTVLDVPPNHSGPATDDATACWRLRAKIWYSPDTYKFVEPFLWCNPLDEVGKDVPLASVDGWFFSGGGGTHTGNQRNEGPAPPQTAIPTDLKHQQFWYPSSFKTSFLNGKMFSSLLYYMGFDWTNPSDRRVWIVEFSQARR